MLAMMRQQLFSKGNRVTTSIGRRSKAVMLKRKQIIDAALTLFSQYGLHGTRLEQVASQAEVSKTNLLYHFPSKEVLYQAVLQDILSLWLTPLRAIEASLQPEQAISDYIRLKLEFSRDHPQASRLFCQEILQGAPLLADELSGDLRLLVEEKASLLQAWMAAGRLRQTDPSSLIFMLWSVTQHYADFACQVTAITGKTLQDDDFFSETLQTLCEVILGGILPPK